MADTPTNNTQPTAPKKGGYGKRPMWQWIVLYVIIGGILYAGVAYWYVNRQSSTDGTTNSTSIY